MICAIFFDFHLMAHSNVFFRALHNGALWSTEKSYTNTKSWNITIRYVQPFLKPYLLHRQNMACSENLRLGSHSSIDIINQQPIIFASSLFMRQCEDNLV